MKPQTLNRKFHYWAAAVVALPVLVILVTGLLLQLKKQSTWVQPPEKRGVGKEPAITMPRLLEICRAAPEAGVRSWADISRVDVRPGKGIAKVTTQNHWEIQIDAQTAEVLQVAYRRSDIIEALHDGSWFHPWAKLGVFLPSAIVLLLLWITGMYLFVAPFLARRRRRLLEEAQARKATGPVPAPATHGVPVSRGSRVSERMMPTGQAVRRAARPDVAREPITTAFTLVELLVVIAIIGVLSSILLPAVSNAKAKATQVSCLSNSRQLSLGVMLYVDDHENSFPPSADYSLPTSDPERIWTAKVLPYVQSMTVFSCPMDSERAFPTNWAVRGLGSIGYTTATAYDPVGVEGFTTFLRADAIENPSAVPLFADTPAGPTGAKYRGFTFDPYNGNDHATDPRLGTPLVSSRDLVRDLTSLPPSALKPVFARHGGSVNVLHADGHAQNFSEKTILAQNTGLQWRFRLRPVPSAAGHR